MTKLPLVLMMFVTVSIIGCGTLEESLARDRTECSGMGFQDKTNEFGLCMLKLKEMRLKQRKNFQEGIKNWQDSIMFYRQSILIKLI